MVVILLVPLVGLAGLAFDGGQALAARRDAADVAFSAARAGAQALGDETGGFVDAAPAAASARAAAAAGGWPAVTVTVTGPDVTVTVTGTVDYALLGLLGVRSGPVTATATATATWGVLDAVT